MMGKPPEPVLRKDDSLRCGKDAHNFEELHTKQYNVIQSITCVVVVSLATNTFIYPCGGHVNDPMCRQHYVTETIASNEQSRAILHVDLVIQCLQVQLILSRISSLMYFYHTKPSRTDIFSALSKKK